MLHFLHFLEIQMLALCFKKAIVKNTFCQKNLHVKVYFWHNMFVPEYLRVKIAGESSFYRWRKQIFGLLVTAV